MHVLTLPNDVPATAPGQANTSTSAESAHFVLHTPQSKGVSVKIYAARASAISESQLEYKVLY